MRFGVLTAMALDTSELGDLQAPLEDVAVSGRARSPTPDVHAGSDIGEALRMAREQRGMSIDELAERTRVRASFLLALEQMRLEALPSRPFVVGYIRACSQVLGLDPDIAAERFKAEEPVLEEPLPEPVGVRDERDPRLAAIVAAAGVIIAAIVAWNVVQRIMTETAPPPAAASATASEKALSQVKSGPVALGAPLPAPVESTTPPPYLTPGIDKATKADGSLLDPAAAAAVAAGATTAPGADLTLPATFTPQGTVYGAPKNRPASVVLQALKPALLVIHGTDGSVYFARQLAPGEAYRVPDLGGLNVDVAEPEAFQVFVTGQSKGVLPAPLTPVARLLGVAPAAARPASATAGPLTSKPVVVAAANKPSVKPSVAGKAAVATGTATPKRAPVAKLVPKAAATDELPPT